MLYQPDKISGPARKCTHYSAHFSMQDTIAESVHVMAVEPFYGGSHRAYLDGVLRRSGHRWNLLTGKAVHWKWRMRSAPIQLAKKIAEYLAKQGQPDVIWCSDMLDLPQFLGFAARYGLEQRPTIAYFHESQWTYPQAKEAREDFHYGYTNLLTAIAADECLFNSAFHRDEFLDASERFVRRMPDSIATHEFEQLRRKCHVVYPGFEPVSTERSSKRKKIIIGWVSRWEHDKRPDAFVELLRLLRLSNVEFSLVLLGSRPRKGSADLDAIRREFAEVILFDGYAESRQEYWSQLGNIDIVVSTADHEFFGIAICEAIDAGAIAVVPDRLSYPEIVATPTRYDSIAEAVETIVRLSDPTVRSRLAVEGKQHIDGFQISRTVGQLDDLIGSIANVSRYVPGA